MRLSLVILLFIAPLLTFAQGGTITGKIINAETQSALPKASVFLTETLYGTSTGDDGVFTLRDVKKGQYLLVVTMVGFEEFTQSISVGAEPVTININLKPRITALREVSVSIPKDWARNYKFFFRRFIGNSSYARKCKILNSEVLNFKYNKEDGALFASADGLIEMENRALGYMVKILLTKSTIYETSIAWYGQIYFEELPGTPAEIKKWKDNRARLMKETGAHVYIAEKLPGDVMASDHP